MSSVKGGQLRSAVFWSAVMSWGGQGIALLSIFITASIVGPESFGLIAMAALCIGFLQLCLEQGYGASLVQRENVEPEHLDSVFWLTLALGIVLTLASIGLAPLWAAANRRVELTLLVRIYSLLIPIKALTVVQEALLVRRMDFRALAVRSTVSLGVGAVIGVGMALKGFGIWALVVEDLVTEVLRLGLLWNLADWRPRLRFSMRHIRELTNFSMHIFSAQLGTFTQSRIDSALVGLFFGAEAVGLYRMAGRLVTTVTELVTRPLTSVVLPYFSRMQGDPKQLKRGVLSSLRASVLITVPTMTILAALAVPICATLGKKWWPAAPVTQVLALCGIARAVTLFTGPLLQATGRPKYTALMTWTLAAANAIAFVAAGMLLRGTGTSHQTLGMAISRAAVFMLLYVPVNLKLMMTACRISLGELFRSLVPGLATSVVVLSIGLAGSHVALGRHSHPLAVLMMVGAVTGAAAVALMLHFDPRLRDLIRLPLRRKVMEVPLVEPVEAAASASVG